MSKLLAWEFLLLLYGIAIGIAEPVNYRTQEQVNYDDNENRHFEKVKDPASKAVVFHKVGEKFNNLGYVHLSFDIDHEELRREIVTMTNLTRNITNQVWFTVAGDGNIKDVKGHADLREFWTVEWQSYFETSTLQWEALGTRLDALRIAAVEGHIRQKRFAVTAGIVASTLLGLFNVAKMSVLQESINQIGQVVSNILVKIGEFFYTLSLHSEAIQELQREVDDITNTMREYNVLLKFNFIALTLTQAYATAESKVRDIEMLLTSLESNRMPSVAFKAANAQALFDKTKRAAEQNGFTLMIDRASDIPQCLASFMLGRTALLSSYTFR